MFVVLAGSTSVASASEVIGTLSSDGSTETTGSGSSQEVTGAATIMDMRGDQALSGTVINGIDSGQESSAVLSTVLWSLSAILVAAILAAVYWRRQSV
jgi:hypothetical protein